jgi:hypothetical protein
MVIETPFPTKSSDCQRHAMQKKDHRIASLNQSRVPKTHLIAVVIFLALSVLSLRDFVFGESLFIYRDMNPVSPGSFLEEALSVFDFEAARRILYYGPYSVILDALGFSILSLQKTSLLLTHFLIGFLAYLGAHKFLGSKLGGKGKKPVIFLIAIFFGFFYIYNPHSAGGVTLTGLGLGFSYALIPLIFYYYDKALNGKGFSDIFITAILITLAVAGTMQFLVLIPLFVLVPWLAIVSLQRWKANESVSRPLRNALIVAAIWMSLSSYWLYFSVMTVLSGSTPQPTYLLTNQTLEVFSSTTSLVNVARLMATWWPWLDLTPIVNEQLWTILTFLVPAAMIASVIYLRHSRLRFYTISFMLIVLFIWFFNKGNQPPLPDLYQGLYDLSIVGWMFRLPSAMGKFLPFYVGMILSFGLYQVLSSRLGGARAIFKFVPIAVLVLSTSVVCWPMFTGDFGGIYKEDDRFQDDTTIDTPPPLYSVEIPRGTIVVAGNSQLAGSVLANLSPVSSSGTLLVPLDKDLQSLRFSKLIPEAITLNEANDLSFHFLSEDSIIIAPASATKDHIPEKMWSTASTTDPLHGPFHSYLQRFNVNNTDGDFGKGLVFTWSNDELALPLDVETATAYELFVRYLANEAGGKLRLSIAQEEFSLSTKAQIDDFVWQRVGSVELERGQHTLVLSSDAGLNAVNVIVLVPAGDMTGIQKRTQEFIDRARIVHIPQKDNFVFEARVVDEITALVHDGLDLDTRFANRVTVPEGATHMVLQYSANQISNTGSYTISDLRLEAVSKMLLDSQFENVSDTMKWSLNDNRYLTLVDELEDPLSGEHSLKVDIKSGTTEIWQVASSYFQAEGDTDLTIALRASAQNTASPHAKLFYYDKDNKIIRDDLIFTSPNRNYNQTFEKVVRTPSGTEHASLQFWMRPDPSRATSFVVDDITVEDKFVLRPAEGKILFKNVNPNEQEVRTNGGSTIIEINNADPAGTYLIRTSPLEVTDGVDIDYSALVVGTGIDHLQAKVVFLSIPQTGTSTSLAENGQPLKVLRGYTIHDKIDLGKTSAYTVAINATTCSECQSLTLSLGSVSKRFSLQSQNEASEWFYFSRYLQGGILDLSLDSDGLAQINDIVIYSDSHNHEPVDAIFAGDEQFPVLTQASMISPTKYEARISTTKPFVVTLDREYSKLWSARVDGEEFQSINAYPMANAFYIDRSGDLDVVIEYKPQVWFYYGSIFAGLAAAISVGYLAYDMFIASPSSGIKKKIPVDSSNKSRSIEKPRMPARQGLSHETPSTPLPTVWSTLERVFDFSMPETMIFVGLVILVITPRLIFIDFAYLDDAMSLMYFLLVGGVLWLFASLLIRKEKKKSTYNYLYGSGSNA